MIHILRDDVKKPKITSAIDLFEKIKEIDIDFSRENFVVFYLTQRNSVINSETVFTGAIDACIVDPRVIFRKALLHNAVKLIVAHNHPSEDLSPSDEDIDIAERLQKLGEMLNIRILDSIIFSKDKFYSLLENDLI
jgi:DNA repair protein RadC